MLPSRAAGVAPRRHPPLLLEPWLASRPSSGDHDIADLRDNAVAKVAESNEEFVDVEIVEIHQYIGTRLVGKKTVGKRSFVNVHRKDSPLFS